MRIAFLVKVSRMVTVFCDATVNVRDENASRPFLPPGSVIRPEQVAGTVPSVAFTQRSFTFTRRVLRLTVSLCLVLESTGRSCATGAGGVPPPPPGGVPPGRP